MSCYVNEKREAESFLLSHKWDDTLQEFMSRMSHSNTLHSQKWSATYDYMSANYPSYVDSGIITGLVYLSEENR